MKEKLYNRDGEPLYFEEIKDNVFVLKPEDSYVLKYCRVIYDGEYGTPDMTISAVDPSGGPYINIGYKLSDGRTLVKIVPVGNGFKFEFV